MMRTLRKAMVLGWLALLSACAATGSQPGGPAVHPAMWEVTSANGARGWLFGTIHALPEPVEWQSPKVRQALASSDRLVVEVGSLDNVAGTAMTLAKLARSPGHPLLSERVRPDLRDELAALLTKAKLSDRQFANLETWAAAVMLTQFATSSGSNDSANGIDRALLAGWKDKPVVELEGAESQLRLFDALPESDQRDLLNAVVTDASKPGESGRLAAAWQRGDMALLDTETRSGMLADPELRAVLFVERNQAWAGKIAAILARGGKPFVAVGGAHMAGSEGLPAMLEAKGYKVRRVQ